jgi:hypothetical protein
MKQIQKTLISTIVHVFLIGALLFFTESCKTSNTSNISTNSQQGDGLKSATKLEGVGNLHRPSVHITDNDIAEVEAKGVGINRADAIQDALRNAIGQAVGVSLSSETRVENFVVIRDAITSRTDGYISSYQIIREIPFPDRYEVIVQSKVSLSPLKADFNVLARAVGGIRFLVMYDERNIAKEDAHLYDFTVERLNEFLSERGYRYIDKRRFDELKRETRGIMHDIKASEETYIQHLGLKADAQFIIFIKKIHSTNRSEAFDTRTSSKIIIEATAYDNCTAEGLGTIILESDWRNTRGEQTQILGAVSEAVELHFSRLLNTFTRYIGNWANNGTPFELRFYHTGTFRELRGLRTKLREDNDFGGDMEIVSFNNFLKLNCTFKNRPDLLADKILDYADAIPELAPKKLDVKFIYGRQINFAPSNMAVEELQILAPSRENNATESPNPIKK